MSFFAVLFALILEQARPLARGNWVHAALQRWARWARRSLDAGKPHHGWLAWSLAVLAPTLLTVLIHWLLLRVNGLLAFAWSVAVLYVTLGFRQFSHYFTDIHLALRLGDLAQARRLLAEWRGGDCARLSSSDVARLAIEQALAASHRHVFAVLLWFVLLGPAGAVLYRISSFLAATWRCNALVGEDSVYGSDLAGELGSDLGAFYLFPQRAFALIDWLPLRATAVAFAIVGDFEDAVYCWRTQASQWFDGGLGIVLASGAGALGVRLGMPVNDGLEIVDRPELGLGAEADVDFMQSAVGLVWRALLLWLLLLLLLGLSGWFGA